MRRSRRRPGPQTGSQTVLALLICSSLFVASSAVSASTRVTAELRDEVSHRSLRVFAATPLMPHDSPSGTDTSEGSTHGGDTRDFGFGPSVMRNPDASGSKGHSRQRQSAALLETQAKDGPLQPTTQGSGSGDESKHGGDTRDYGFGPGVMIQIKEDGSSNPSEKKSGGDTHDFGFGVGVMMEVADDTNGAQGENSKSGGDTRDFGFGPSVMLQLGDDSSSKGDVDAGEKKSGGDTHDFGFGVGVMLESQGKIKPTIPDVKIQYDESSTLADWKKAKAKGKASGGSPNFTNPFIRQQDTENMKPVSVIPKNANEVVRQLALNPHAYQRECPVSLCPGNMRCPHEGGSCCKNGALCCPLGSSCINSDPPMCVLDTKADPNLCDYQQCDRNYSCPFSGVPICCLGGNGRSCCDVGYSCVAGDPPSCQKLTPAGKMLQLDEFTKMLKRAAKGKISLLRPHDIKRPKKSAAKKAKKQTKKTKKSQQRHKRKQVKQRTSRKTKTTKQAKQAKKVPPKTAKSGRSSVKQAAKAAKKDESIKIGAPAASGKKEGFLYGRGKAKAPSSAKGSL